MVGVAVKVTAVPEQMVVAEAATATDGVTAELTVMVTAFEVALVGEAQLAVLVITQVITSPWARAALVYVALLLPTLVPFFFHW